MIQVRTVLWVIRNGLDADPSIRVLTPGTATGRYDTDGITSRTLLRLTGQNQPSGTTAITVAPAPHTQTAPAATPFVP
jgi:hypothetical protein